MLPNELIDKILEYKYHYQDFKKFLSKIKKVNREYKNKYKAFEIDVNSREDKISYPYILGINHFIYNYRILSGRYILSTYIFNFIPHCHQVAELSKNYRYQSLQI